VDLVPTRIPDVVLLKPRVFHDERGYLLESWNRSRFLEAGIAVEFVQDTHSHSRQWVLRGLHYQVQQAQGKYAEAEKSYDTAIGFAALDMSGAQGKSMTLVPARRLIVIAAQGRNLNWDEEAGKISEPLRGAAFQILGIEYRKQPDSPSLSKLLKAFANLLNLNGP
jgi:hypothetical protein